MHGSTLGVYTVFIMLVGGALTQAFIEPDPEYKVIHDTKTVVETVTETEYVEVEADPAVVERAPDVCLLAAQLGHKAGDAASTLSTNATRTLDLIAEARQAAVTGDTYRINDIETEIRDLQEEATDALIKVADAGLEYDVNYNACKEFQ